MTAFDKPQDEMIGSLAGENDGRRDAKLPSPRTIPRSLP